MTLNEIKNRIHATFEKCCQYIHHWSLLDDKLITDKNLTLSVDELAEDFVPISDLNCCIARLCKMQVRYQQNAVHSELQLGVLSSHANYIFTQRLPQQHEILRQFKGRRD